MRRVPILVVLVAALLSAGAAIAASNFPGRIDLPDGFRPEGIADGPGQSLFIGSIPTGAVYRADARSGKGQIVVPAKTGRAAIGMKYGKKHRLFVAGGPTGKAFVYDARTGADLAEFQLSPQTDTFVNDVVLTKRTAYFTDSRRSVLYAVATDLSGFREIALPDVPLLAGFNLNGIAATHKARWLLAVQGGETGDLWRIDPGTGAATRVDLGGKKLLNGDGLLLERKRTLYVVQNQLNKIAVVRLSKDFASGEIVREITSPGFAVPTTIARQGRALYAVNARFGTPPTPETDYWVTRVEEPKKKGKGKGRRGKKG